MSTSEFSLKSKTAIVTGGKWGIGRAIADIFSSEGSTVIALDINFKECKKTVDIIKNKGFNAIPIRCDLSDINSINKTIIEISNNFKKIDILVNNAGIFSTTPILDMTVKEWDKVMDTNLKGPFFLSKEILKIMIENKYGKIINMSSLTAKTGGRTSGVNYGVSKAGLISVTKYLAKFGAKYGINVNAILPAFVETQMNLRLKEMLDYIPLGRIASPGEIAKVALFLASDDSSYITGEMIDVDGGYLMD